MDHCLWQENTTLRSNISVLERSLEVKSMDIERETEERQQFEEELVTMKSENLRMSTQIVDLQVDLKEACKHKKLVSEKRFELCQ